MTSRDPARPGAVVGGVEAYTRLAAVYDEIVVDPTYGRWAAFLHRRWAQDRRGVRAVLDVCCGTGLLAAELHPLGYQVCGVDSSAAMLARARTRLGPCAALVQDTLPALTPRGPFDAAVSTFDGLNYLALPDLRATLVAVAARLRPDGWFVFDLHTDALMEFTAANPVVSGHADGMDFTIRSEVDTAARSCSTTIEVVRASDGDTFVERHRQHFFSDAQVRAALTAAGFHRIEVTDEYTEQPAGADTLRATWIARRPDPSSTGG
jgi:predicted TPR repeat methyltransferase